MARLTVVSGVGDKLPAAFLLEIEGRRILLDLGEGPAPGVLPDVSALGAVDAICVSHAHTDHAGGLRLAARLGNPPIYASAATIRQLPPAIAHTDRLRILPEIGDADIEGVRVRLGRSGHAPGGIWFHFPAEGGFLYTGDWSVESALLPFDQPPPALCVVTDASYGDRDSTLACQIDRIVSACAGGAVLPVPSAGRGPEMVLTLLARGLAPRACPQIRMEIEGLLAGHHDAIATLPRHEREALLARPGPGQDWQPTEVIVAAEANGEAGLSADLVRRRDARFRFIFSGHVPQGTPAAHLLATGQAQWLPWNVHPRLRDILDLARTSGARHIVPAFAKRDGMALLRERLGNRIRLDRSFEFGSHLSHPLSPTITEPTASIAP
ncbi:MBL fold metallo-hydrolase [Chelatococcus asaccharovorans]|uniref:Cft2 family RNA processing exonuclease n=1 Tax=Chelatococcus asaccharovorans TaxID=28210 RepID=A0A2V3U0I8_9HYPH|nr:MBL fold metallo-hydrolase [Chelatococcus asaccharovorans]MBS7707591.1 MBL fold metallo-hydrolase [Chelatococcus asaccharovorans]PXW55165.1 Cft2 family RNA processing exonuclease [Chelatococcus asaccharovorans]